MQATVQVRTIERTTGHFEFYRTYDVGGQFAIWQYGAQGNNTGRAGGQFRLELAATAESKIRAKKREGYTDVADYTFSMDDSTLTALRNDPKAAKKIGALLDDIRQTTEPGAAETQVRTLASVTHAAPAGVGASAPAATDALDQLVSDLQRAIGDMADNPTSGLLVLDEFRERVEVADAQTLRIKSFLQTLELLTVDAVMGR